MSPSLMKRLTTGPSASCKKFSYVSFRLALALATETSCVWAWIVFIACTRSRSASRCIGLVNLIPSLAFYLLKLSIRLIVTIPPVNQVGLKPLDFSKLLHESKNNWESNSSLLSATNGRRARDDLLFSFLAGTFA